MNLTSQEKSLKDLLEDRGPGSECKQQHAELTIRMFKGYEGISYDEVMQLYEENQQTLSHTPWTDIAHEHLMHQRNKLLQLATALNDLHILGRTDHLFPVHALVSIGSTAVECTFYAPKLHYYEVRRNKHLETTIREKAWASSEWCNSVRNGITVDFVEL